MVSFPSHDLDNVGFPPIADIISDPIAAPKKCGQFSPVAHFDDLTPYVYGGGDPNPAVLNVGWLSSSHPFSKGTAVRDFVDALRKLVSVPVNLYRGRHYCEFCPPPQFSRSATGVVSIVDRDCAWGNGEIRVEGDNDVIYVAPTLILHYVEDHDYAPPDVFVRAVQSAV